MARNKNERRIYFVSLGETQGMVRASSKAQAIAYVMRDMVAEVASQEQIVSWLGYGNDIDDAPQAKKAGE